jgi:hypothetical protein
MPANALWPSAQINVVSAIKLDAKRSGSFVCRSTRPGRDRPPAQSKMEALSPAADLGYPPIERGTDRASSFQQSLHGQLNVQWIVRQRGCHDPRVVHPVGMLNEDRVQTGKRAPAATMIVYPERRPLTTQNGNSGASTVAIFFDRNGCALRSFTSNDII